MVTQCQYNKVSYRKAIQRIAGILNMRLVKDGAADPSKYRECAGLHNMN